MTERRAPDQDVVLSSRVRLARNYEDIPFTPRLNDEWAGITIERAREAIDPDGSDFSFLRMAELSSNEKKRLVEHHLVSYDLMKYPNWSAALISSGQTISIMINEEDHLRIQGLLPGLQLERAAELAFSADDRLCMQDAFAFDPQWGYLTACPTNAGTGMRASTMLHLPALSAAGQINAVVQMIAKLGMTVRGMYGEGSDAVGSIYQLSNQVTLGRAEEDILRSLVAATNEIAGHERSLREQMHRDDPIGVTDKLMRSVGILKSARLMTATEMMPRLSDLRFASTIGLVDYPLPVIDHLMVDLQPGSLAARAGESAGDRDRDALRADLLRDALKEL